MTIRPEPDVELALAAIPEAIRRAGFTPSDMRVVARGRYEVQDGASVFRIRGWSSELPVRGGATPSDEVELRARVEVVEGEPVLVPLVP